MPKKAATSKSKPKSTRKVKDNIGFLTYLAHNPYPTQSKKFLRDLINSQQVLLLQELIANDRALNIPSHSQREEREHLKLKSLQKIACFRRGRVHKACLEQLYPWLKILARDTLKYHGCS